MPVVGKTIKKVVHWYHRRREMKSYAYISEWHRAVCLNLRVRWFPFPIGNKFSELRRELQEHERKSESLIGNISRETSQRSHAPVTQHAAALSSHIAAAARPAALFLLH